MTDLPTLAFIDTETTSLETTADVWDFAVILRAPGEPDVEHQMFVEHDQGKALRLPEPFLSDYHARFDPASAVVRSYLGRWMRDTLQGAIIVGAVPSFDTIRLQPMLGEQQVWHYQLIDVETLVVGYLSGYNDGAHAYVGRSDTYTSDPVPTPPWDSDALSSMVGAVNGGRHTALGDARWARDVFDEVCPWPAYRRILPG